MQISLGVDAMALTVPRASRHLKGVISMILGVAPSEHIQSILGNLSSGRLVFSRQIHRTEVYQNERCTKLVLFIW